MSDTHSSPVGVPEDLLLACETWKATQQLRIATSNRIEAFRRAAKKAGAPTPDLRVYEAQLKAFNSIEGKLRRRVERIMRDHPLAPWVEQRHGIGLVLVAQLVQTLGTISYNKLAERWRRGPAELWSVCGLAPDQRLQKGHRANWSVPAKIIALQLAAACKMQGPASPYEPVYREYRERYAARTHDKPCAQCGIKKQPAPPGSPWRPGHQEAAAIRATAKRILRDLFVEARRLGI